MNEEAFKEQNFEDFDKMREKVKDLGDALSDVKFFYYGRFNESSSQQKAFIHGILFAKKSELDEFIASIGALPQDIL